MFVWEGEVMGIELRHRMERLPEEEVPITSAGSVAGVLESCPMRSEPDGKEANPATDEPVAGAIRGSRQDERDTAVTTDSPLGAVSARHRDQSAGVLRSPTIGTVTAGGAE